MSKALAEAEGMVATATTEEQGPEEEGAQGEREALWEETKAMLEEVLSRAPGGLGQCVSSFCLCLLGWVWLGLVCVCV